MKQALMTALLASSVVVANYEKAIAHDDHSLPRIQSAGFATFMNVIPAYDSSFSGHYNSRDMNRFNTAFKTRSVLDTLTYSRHGSFYPTTSYRQAVPSYGFSGNIDGRCLQTIRFHKR